MAICKNCGHEIYSKDYVWYHTHPKEKYNPMYDNQEVETECKCGCLKPEPK